MADEDNNLPPSGEQPAAQPSPESYASEGYQYQEDNAFDDEPSLSDNAPSVAGAQNKRFIVIIMGIIAAVFIVVMFFSGDDTPSDQPEVQKEEEVVVPPPSDAANMANPTSTPEALPAPVIPDLPPAPPTQEDTTVPPPPPPVPTEIAPPLPPPDVEPTVDDEAAAQKRDQRRRSGMLVISGSGAASKTEDATTRSNNPADPNLSFANAQPTDSEQVIARRVGKLDNMIVQGKIVEAVLETAVNSDLPGPIRAIVSRDIYSEGNKNILLPKGSRLIGTYNTSLLTGQRRVYIVWSRVIRPDGIDVMIDSPGIDQIGRAGIEGIVDNKYLEIYSNAILSSILTIGIAKAGDEVGGGEVTQTQNAIGGTQTTGTPSAMATQQAVSDLGSVTKSLTSKVIDMRPTIMLDQGTRVNVFVNKDLIFPADLFKNTQFIQ